MSDWLDPVREALDERASAVRVFVRDDDGGWDDPALTRLIHRSVAAGVSIDVAVIPTAIADSRSVISERVNRGDMRVHQHGLFHVDRATAGRSCEFGEERSPDAVRDDLEAGRSLLERGLDCPIDPVFTPPWNRCSRATAEALSDLGYRVLSREAGAERFGLAALIEIPVTFDWFAKRKGTPLTRDERGHRLGAQLRDAAVVGIMLHHAVTGDDELCEIERLFAVLSSSARVDWTTIMQEAERQPVTM